MKWITSSLIVLLPLFVACSKESPKVETHGSTPPPPAAPVAPTANVPVKVPDKEVPATPAPAAAVVDMDAAIAVLMAKPEHNAPSVEVQHVLIAFAGSGVPTATRSKEDAKALAQKVYAEAIGGADFLELVKKYTNDSAPGIYPMTSAGRRGMVRGFGDVGWRLEVGEIGVSPYDPKSSPFGWHIIKRLK